jgi:hypothetical protein
MAAIHWVSPSGCGSRLAAASGAAPVGGLLAAGAVMVLAGLGVLAASTWAEWGGSSSPDEEAATSRVRVAEEVPVTAMHQGRGVANNSPELAALSLSRGWWQRRFVGMRRRLGVGCSSPGRRGKGGARRGR